jgi:hypothetical protein
LAGLLITSRSPLWQQYIEHTWLPRIGERVAVLNWSDRRSWARGIQRALFWTVSQPHFCPAIIVVRPHGEPFVFRFYRAFHALKHGNEGPLRQLEAEAFEAVDRSDWGRSNLRLQPPAASAIATWPESHS